MKKILCLIVLLAIAQVCYADFNAFETRQDAYDRRSNENYNTYKNNNYQAPLGGYNRPMNDNGGRQYGMNQNQGMNSYSQNNSGNYNNGGFNHY